MRFPIPDLFLKNGVKAICMRRIKDLEFIADGVELLFIFLLCPYYFCFVERIGMQ